MAASIKSVTQATSKTTAVTLNAYSGRVISVALTDAANATFNFTLNNNKITNNCVINLGIIYAGAGEPKVSVYSQTKGSCVIKVKNVDASAALNAALTVTFSIDPNIH
jgi:hypothetical protein